MVPVGEREYDFFIVEIFVWVIRVIDDQRAAQAIRILAPNMGVVPVRSRLIDLEKSVDVSA